MRILTGFAIVLAVTGGVAAAEPERVRYGDSSAPAKQAQQDQAWTQLATPTPVKHGTEFVVVGKEQGTFGKLRIDADKGTVVVRRVKVVYDDGKQQVIEVDQRLGPHRKSTELALDHAGAIDRIVVTTEASGNGEYEIYGSSAVGVATR